MADKAQKQEKGDTISRDEFKELKTIFYAIGIVAIIAVVGLITQYMINSAVAYQNLDNQVSAQNAKIDTLIQIDTQILLGSPKKKNL